MNTTPPNWEHCGTGADDADPVGCRGIVIRSTGRCLVHCDDTERQSYLDELAPGADIDLRGTTISEEMLDALLNAVRDTEARAPRIGDAEFSEVVFTGDARFGEATFTGAARFYRTKFTGAARFDKVNFSGTAWFYETWFTGIAWFPQATFRGDVEFSRAWFYVDARFNKATFGQAITLGPMTCERTLDFESAVFENSVLIFAAVRYVSCSKARFQEPSTLRLLHAQVDLTDAVLLHPVTVTTGSDPHVRRVSERGLPTKMSIRSLRGVDAAMLLISDVDLRSCVFTGTHHLDQLRLEGEWQFATTSEVARWRSGMIPRRRSRRQVIYEERLWRTRPNHRRSQFQWDWSSPPNNYWEEPPSVEALATTYRQLRKCREDAKDEPGAADFYYGEMEMRRYSHGWGSVERWLLTAYWALSGYGLRASRALVALAAASFATVCLMMAFGLPNDEPKQEVQRVRTKDGMRWVVDKPAPKLTLPFEERLSAKRFEKSLRVTLNSVVFRSSGQDLTTVGTYVEMASRFTEPVLLGLAALAIRSRVKRGN